MKFNEETILNYLDGQLSEEDSKRLLAAIEKDDTLRRLFDNHREIHNTLLKEKMPSPSPGFANRVMATVYQIQASRSKFFNRGRIFVIALIGLVLITTAYYLSVRFYPTLGDSIANDITMREYTLDLNPAKTFLNSDTLFKIIFYVNGIVCLFLLDRAVLKPYFARRRERYSM